MRYVATTLAVAIVVYLMVLTHWHNNVCRPDIFGGCG